MLQLTARILIVDNMSSLRKITKNILEELGYLNIEEVENGSIALDLMKKEKIENRFFDLIISEINMPVMNGFELLLKLSEGDDFSNSKILIVSSLGDTEDVMNCIELGAVGYIIKPVTDKKLKSKLENL